MTKLMRLIKTALIKIYFFYPRWKYSRKVLKGGPITISLPKGISLRFYPWGQIAESLYLGRYEKLELALTISYLKEGMNIIDIGANIGLYSILASKIVGKGGRIWSFEPSSETYKHFLKNLSLNNADSVIPNNLALSNIVDGKISLRRDPGRRDAERYLSVNPKNLQPCYENSVDPGDSELVTVTSLDTYMKKNLGNVRIDFIKVDVEGHEYEVFRGAEKLLISNRNVILFFECSAGLCLRAGYKIDDVFNFLRKLDFKLFRWNKKLREWQSDEDFLLLGGNVWACRHEEQLLELKS